MTCRLVIKRLVDVTDVRVDYASWLRPGDTIIDAQASADDIDVTVGWNDKEAVLTVGGGQDGDVSTIRLVARTRMGSVKNDCIYVCVK